MSPKKPISDDALDSLLKGAASEVRQAHDSLLSTTLVGHKKSVIEQALNSQAISDAKLQTTKHSPIYAWWPALGATALVMLLWMAGRNQLAQHPSRDQATEVALLAQSYHSDEAYTEDEDTYVSFSEFGELMAEEASDFGQLTVDDEFSNYEMPSMELGLSFSDIEYMEDIYNENE
jgi:hypothetical protein